MLKHVILMIIHGKTCYSDEFSYQNILF